MSLPILPRHDATARGSKGKMKTSPLFGILLSSALLSAFPALAAPTSKTATQPIKADGPIVEMVFAIDCSGSMGGVIETAKQKVWDIVNQVALAKPAPRLRIGLLGYGNADRTWRKFDLSDDLDTVYGNLTTFRDEGWADEYVGQAVQKSLAEMSWTPSKNAGKSLKVIYVLGNETAQQGPISYVKIAPIAPERGVFVNAIYCGNAGGQDTWQQMAALGGGKYLTIAADGGSVMIPTPYDARLGELNLELNGTYLAYGARGAAAAANQSAQDSNAMAAGGAYSNAARAVAKSQALYSNSTWDLVDKSKDPKFKLEAVPEKELPAAMQKMTPAQRADYLKGKIAERAALQREIGEIGTKRAAFLTQEMKKAGKTNSLDAALLQLVRSQALQRGFKFGK